MKRTKKFLKAYEDIQLNQPMPQAPQQPAFMQPPGGQVQAQNQQLAASVAPEAAEAGPTSFTQMAGGMGGQQGMEGDAGPAGAPGDPTPGTTRFPNTIGKEGFVELGGGSDGSPSGTYNAYARGRQINQSEMNARNPKGANTPPGTDPGLAEEGNPNAREPQVQRERMNSEATMRQFGKKNAAGTAEIAAKDVIGSEYDLRRQISILEKDLKKGSATTIETDPRTGKTYPIPGMSEKAIPAAKEKLTKLKDELTKIEQMKRKAWDKFHKINASIPNKALGLGVGIGGSLMADAYAADAETNTPEMRAGRAVDQGAPGRNDNPRTSAAHQAYLEQQAKSGNYMVNRKPGARGQEPIEYSAGEDVRIAQ